MKLHEFNAFCTGLAGTTKVIQWRGAHVWKVGGKIFAIASIWGTTKNGEPPPVEASRISFKCSDFSYAILIEQEGIIPAPYLARAKWVQLQHADAMDDDDLEAYITQAHEIIAARLMRLKRSELGLDRSI